MSLKIKKKNRHQLIVALAQIHVISNITLHFSFSQVWSLPILLLPSPCRVPSWDSSSSSLGLVPLLALACWLLFLSNQLAGCLPTKILVRVTINSKILNRIQIWNNYKLYCCYSQPLTVTQTV